MSPKEISIREVAVRVQVCARKCAHPPAAAKLGLGVWARVFSKYLCSSINDLIAVAKL